MKNKKSYLILFLIYCSSLFINQVSFSQQLFLSDRLIKKLDSVQEDSSKINLLLKLGALFEASNHDSAVYYYNQGLQIALNGKDQNLTIPCYNKLGFFYRKTGNYDLGIKTYLLLLKTCENQKNVIEEADCYLNLAEIYIFKSNYPKSLKLFQKAIKLFEHIGKSNNSTVSLTGKKGIVNCYNNIGSIHAENGNFPLATEYFQKALKTEEQIGDKRVISGCYNNIGNVFYMQHNFPQAIEYYQKSLKMAIEINDKQGMSERYNNLGLVYADNHENNKAIDFYMKSFNIDEELGNKKGMAIVLGNISLLKIQLKNYTEAILFAERSLEISKTIGSLDDEKSAYNYLAISYDSLRNYKKTSEYLKLFKLMNDSIFNLESSKQIKEIEAVYQTEKKQKEIELLNKDKKLQETELSKQVIQKTGFIIGFILMIILSLVIFRSYNHKKKANNLLTFQKNQIEENNEELNQQNEEIAAQRDEIEAQRDLVTFQKEEIEVIHSELTSSIHYAKRIQNAVLPNKEFIESLLTDYFILLKPRNIVSGDFYWLTIKKNFLMVAVADCTGHGVPGAFMSMLGISFLNEIINRPDLNQASQVLNILRDSVLKSLHQKGVVGEQKDGMDISLLIINTETNECQWAGANNSLYIITSQQPSVFCQQLSDSSLQTADFSLPTANCRLFELKGDKMPVSIYRNMQDFTNHEFTLQKSDILYLSSDGYSDQFGGPNERKYLSKNLKKLLLDNCDKPMTEQKTILNDTIESWMNNFGKSFEQTDDITIMGIKI